MVRTRAALLGTLALLLVSGVTTSTASAGGPYWHVGGARLGQGVAKQITLQVKGAFVIDSASPVLATECASAVSEGATIEGQGQSQGQDKGRFKLTKCMAITENGLCTVEEPITTSQLKSHLVTFRGGQKKYADLFEPQQGVSILAIKIIACGTLTGIYKVDGSVAAEFLPAEVENQEGLFNFPLIPINEVFLEQQTKKPELKIGIKKAEIIAAFGARLATNERFGVFGT